MRLKYHVIILVSIFTIAFDTTLKAQNDFKALEIKIRASHISLLEKYGTVADDYLGEMANNPLVFKTVIFLEGCKDYTFTALYWHLKSEMQLTRITMQPTDTGIHYTEAHPVEPTALEKNLQTMQFIALNYMANDSGFKRIAGIYIELIPVSNIVYGKKCYIMRRSAEGEIIFGDDYILEFDENIKLTHATKVHDNLSKLDSVTLGSETVPFHKHVNESPCYSETDLSAVYLYQRKNKWKKFLFTSDDEAAVWNFATDKIEHIALTGSSKKKSE